MDAVLTVAETVNTYSFEVRDDESASRRTRERGRIGLTWLAWPGDLLAAVDVLAALVANALEYGTVPGGAVPVSVQLSTTIAGELLVDVSDANPEFPDFADAVRGLKGRGLSKVKRLGAEMDYLRPADAPGKTVRAILLPS